MSGPAANGGPVVLFGAANSNQTGHSDSTTAAARVPGNGFDNNYRESGSEDPDSTSKSVVDSGSDADNTVVRTSRQSASDGPADAEVISGKGRGERNETNSFKETEDTDEVNEDIIKDPETNYIHAFLQRTQEKQLDEMNEHAKNDLSTFAGEEHGRNEETVEKHVIPGDVYDGPIDADIVLVRDGSRIEVIIEPLPEDRHAEYQMCSHSDYVYQGNRRMHERDSYETEYGDGARSEISRRDIYHRPNGSNVRRTFKRRELEENNGLSSARYDLKRRRLWLNGGRMTGSSVTSEVTSRSSSPTSTQSPGFKDESSMDIDLDDNRESRLYLNTPHAHMRTQSKRVQPSIEYTLRSMTNSSEDDDDDVIDGRRSRARASRFSSRLDQSRKVASRRLTQDDDVDELGGDNDADFISNIHSNTQVVSKSDRGKWKHQYHGSTAATKNRFARDSSFEFKNARRSSRANKNTRRMVDPTNYDDESLYADYDVTPIQPRLRPAGLKEIFQPLEASSPFRDFHMQICYSCSEPATKASEGMMIYCQGCSLAFHKECIGQRKSREHAVTKVTANGFVLQCRFCVNHAKTKNPSGPSLDRCSVCYEIGASCAPFAPKKSAKEEELLRQQNEGVDPITPVDPELVNSAGNVFFRCTQCHRAFHYEHLPPPPADCVDEEIADIRKERLAQYSLDGKCRDCLDVQGKFVKVIAWRPAIRNSAVSENEKSAQVSFDDISEDDKEYLIKWDKLSYDHCEWRPGPWVVNICQWTRVRQAFLKRNDGANIPPVFDKESAFPAEYLYPDIIFMVRYKHDLQVRSKKEGLTCIKEVEQIMVKFQGLGYEATVWDDVPPPDSGERWNTFVSAYDEYLNGEHFRIGSQKSMRGRVKDFQRSKFKLISQQPAVLRHGKLMPYQMEGLNWLLFNYYKGKSVVLADEMGLGKTVQVIALLSTLILEAPRTWPFLVVVPNSTCSNWRREIKNWAPDLRVVSYHGGRVSQSMAYDYELFPGGKQAMHAHVVIMSYESAQDEKTHRLFHNVRWSGLIVDEGQRLKNDNSLLYLALRRMDIGFRLLLTGTPLQNNKRELFNLLQFVDSSNDAIQLDKTYDTITAENLPELHKLIRPYFLRRTKAEVLGFLPPMAQIIVPVSMTVVQEKLCKSILSKNPQLVRSIFSKEHSKSTDRASCNNILMQLRKCLCHPFVYSEAIEERNVEVEQMHHNLIEASAKLLLLKIMLPKLKERGHRVLIFSQFLNQLDIIEDFMHITGLSYQRLDGSISSLEKQRRIDAFNAPDSQLFAFLLSTRAGGVGINLATADTVLVLDPDFNPHQDIQAFSRAHRIGQKNKVLCFQLMTKDSVEEKIMQIGRSKMALDHALIETMDADDDAGNDVESILRHGAEALFSEDAARDRIVYDDASVEKLLDRSQVENTRTDDKKSAESQFSFARVWANEMGILANDIELTTTSSTANDDQDTNAAMLSVWDKIISEREAEAARLAESQREVLGRGGRRRTKIVYEQTYPKSGDGADDGVLLDGDGNTVSDGSPEKKTKKKRRSKIDEDGDFLANNDGDDSSEHSDSHSPLASDLTAVEASTLTRDKQKPRSKLVTSGYKQLATGDHLAQQAQGVNGPVPHSDSNGQLTLERPHPAEPQPGFQSQVQVLQQQQQQQQHPASQAQYVAKVDFRQEDLAQKQHHLGVAGSGFQLTTSGTAPNAAAHDVNLVSSETALAMTMNNQGTMPLVHLQGLNSPMPQALRSNLAQHQDQQRQQLLQQSQYSQQYQHHQVLPQPSQQSQQPQPFQQVLQSQQQQQQLLPQIQHNQQHQHLQQQQQQQQSRGALPGALFNEASLRATDSCAELHPLEDVKAITTANPDISRQVATQLFGLLTLCERKASATQKELQVVDQLSKAHHQKRLATAAIAEDDALGTVNLGNASEYLVNLLLIHRKQRYCVADAHELLRQQYRLHLIQRLAFFHRQYAFLLEHKTGNFTLQDFSAAGDQRQRNLASTKFAQSVQVLKVDARKVVEAVKLQGIDGKLPDLPSWARMEISYAEALIRQLAAVVDGELSNPPHLNGNGSLLSDVLISPCFSSTAPISKPTSPPVPLNLTMCVPELRSEASRAETALSKEPPQHKESLSYPEFPHQQLSPPPPTHSPPSTVSLAAREPAVPLPLVSPQALLQGPSQDRPQSLPQGSAMVQPFDALGIPIMRRCHRCNVSYLANDGCANTDCELSIRLAIDALRNSKIDFYEKTAKRMDLKTKLGKIVRRARM